MAEGLRRQMMLHCDKLVDELVDKGIEMLNNEDDVNLDNIWESLFYDFDGHKSPDQGFTAGVLASALTALIEEKV